MSTSSRGPSPLKQILSDHFTVSTLQRSMAIKQFCEDKGICISDRKSVHIFLELDSFEKKSDLIDVILQDKVSQCTCMYASKLHLYLLFQKTGLLYTGPVARHLVKDYYQHRGGPDQIKWRVFVLCKYEENMLLQPGTSILYQVCS